MVPHELRHTAASLAIASGADVKQVQNMLGHRSATITLDLYGHLWNDDTVAASMDGAYRYALPRCHLGRHEARASRNFAQILLSDTPAGPVTPRASDIDRPYLASGDQVEHR